MAAYQVKAPAQSSVLDLSGPTPTLTLTIADVATPPQPSPVHALHETLDAAFEPAPEMTGEDRWSLRRMVTFVVAVCGAFWLALAAAVYVLLA
jgi:hypothetical protein